MEYQPWQADPEKKIQYENSVKDALACRDWVKLAYAQGMLCEIACYERDNKFKGG